jgi:transcription antitermination factor NusG
MEPQHTASDRPHSATSDAWCALYTRHQHEKNVAYSLTGKGFEVVLPLYRASRHWTDRHMVLSLPLFPCYVFVRGGIVRRRDVLTTPGVLMIVRSGDNAATIPEEEIDALRKAVDGPHGVEPHPFLKCGERARIKRGPLEGIEGLVLRNKNLCRLVLSVQMVAQSVAVEVDASDLEPIADVNRRYAGN